MDLVVLTIQTATTIRISARAGTPADHGIGLSLERLDPIEPVQIGMTDEQPGLEHIQFAAIGLPLFQRR